MNAVTRISFRRFAFGCAIAFVLIGLLLVEERLRGKWKLAAVKKEMAKRGQAVEFKQLLTPAPPNFREYTNRFVTVGSNLGESFFHGGGNVVEVAPGRAAQGSQASHPVNYRPDTKVSFTNDRARLETNPTNTWAMLEQRLATNQAALAELRGFLRAPLPVLSADYLADAKSFRWPNLVGVRRSAQVLNDSVVFNLHRGDLRAAEEDLVALSGLVRMNEKDPTLVGAMIRVAIAGLSSASLWDAVQAEGWTESQLEHIQRSWQMGPLLPAVAGALHAERLQKLEHYEVFRQGSYREWQSRAVEKISDLGWRFELPDYPIEVWRHYVLHPLWKFAWADLEEALWLERTDFITGTLQEALRRRAFGNLEWEKPTESKEPMFSRFTAWRFYLELPVIEKMSEIIGPNQGSSAKPERSSSSLYKAVFKVDFTIPKYDKAVYVAARNENRRQMAVASLALKRYQLRHGRFPDQLSALVPDLLPDIPVDWMSGNPLLYRLNTDGTYTLYSVGENGRDDGGDPGKDEIWPATVPWEK